MLRCSLVLLFETPSQNEISLSKAYLLGLRFDVRYVSITSLLIFLIGCIPFLHPLHRKWGRRVSLWIWFLFILFFCVFYSVDFINYAYFNQRLNAGILYYFQYTDRPFMKIWQAYPIAWGALAVVIAIASLFSIVKWTYNVMLSRQNYATTNSKRTWGVLFFILLVFGVIGKPVFKEGQHPLRWIDAFESGNDYAGNIALNPFQSFFSSFKFNYKYNLKKEVNNKPNFFSPNDIQKFEKLNISIYPIFIPVAKYKQAYLTNKRKNEHHVTEVEGA